MVTPRQRQYILEQVGEEALKEAESIRFHTRLYDVTETPHEKTLEFLVIAYDYYDRYYPVFEFNRGGLLFNCNCFQFDEKGSCPHIAACFLQHTTELIPRTKEDVLELSQQIFKSFQPASKGKIKKQLTILFGLDISDSSFTFYLRVGHIKTYMLREQKIRSFTYAYYQRRSFKLGQALTYDPDEYYISSEDEEIVDFLNGVMESGRYQHLNQLWNSFFHLLENRTFEIKGIGLIQGIKKTSPFKMRLEKVENDLYRLMMLPANYYYLTDEYLVKDKEVYRISNQHRQFLLKVTETKLTELLFRKEDLPSFSQGLLPVVKDDIEVDESVTDLVLPTTPQVKLYFDFSYNKLKCNLKLGYQAQELDYFDTDHKEILRDYEYESKVIEALTTAGFTIDKNSISISDLDKIGAFLETHLETLTSTYEVFTSSKVKEVNIQKKNKPYSTFSIGKDNIMHYELGLDGVDEEELEKVLASYHKKKKYYRLKSGDFLSLENEQLKELDQFMEEMDITSGEGEIPKYRALYLDSIKQNKYDFIKTDNLFDQFITNFNTYKNISLNLASSDQKILRDYQLLGVKWLYTIYKCDLGGILADEMGLGKSIQTIYFIKQVLSEKPDAKFLITVPTALVYNWENEIRKFAPTLSYQVNAGSKASREPLLKAMSEKGNVFITSYGLLREDYDFYKDIFFEAMIIDEAQNIKNRQALVTKTVKKIKARTKLALTGTPIENSPLELHSIFDFVMPGFLGSDSDFQSRYRIKEFDEDTNQLLQGLRKQIMPFIMRRKKSDVITDLPEKIENVIYINLGSEESKLYAMEVRETERRIEEIIQNEGVQKARFMILQLLTKLRQLCIDPRLVYDNYHKESSKMENLIKVVEEVIENGHKLLLFTSFKSALSIVREKLEEKNIASYTIDGSVSSKKRMDLVDAFQKDDTPVFLITLKSGGTGLNLTAADVVIHLDLWWNPQAENQATDRVHRIGQTNTVEVIKMVAKGTIEEKILALQEKKKLLSDKVIEGDQMAENVLSALTEKEIKDLLSYQEE